MEAEARHIDFFGCPVVAHMHNVLRASECIVLVPQGHDGSITLGEWKHRNV